MKGKLIVIAIILILLAIPICQAQKDNLPPEIPPSKIIVIGRCHTIDGETEGKIQNGNNYLDGEDIHIVHRGKGRLLVYDNNKRIGEITLKVFRANTNIIDIVDFSGKIIWYRQLGRIILIGTHENMDITTWL